MKDGLIIDPAVPKSSSEKMITFYLLLMFFIFTVKTLSAKDTSGKDIKVNNFESLASFLIVLNNPKHLITH